MTRPDTHVARRLASGVSAAALLFVGGIGFIAGGDAIAGPNAGGTLLLHGLPTVILTTDPEFSVCDPYADDCAELVTSVEPDTTRHRWVQVLAAFPPGSSPRLSGVVFGIDYDDAYLGVEPAEPCTGPVWQDANWPAPGSGIAVTWTAAQTGHLVLVALLSVITYDEDMPVVLELTPHPAQGGFFVDDSVAGGGLIDPIAAYGALGFGTSGELICPEDDPVPVRDVTWGALKARQ